MDVDGADAIATYLVVACVPGIPDGTAALTAWVTDDVPLGLSQIGTSVACPRSHKSIKARSGKQCHTFAHHMSVSIDVDG